MLENITPLEDDSFLPGAGPPQKQHQKALGEDAGRPRQWTPPGETTNSK